MDSLMVPTLTDYSVENRAPARRAFREDSSFGMDGLISSTPCRASKYEHIPLRSSPSSSTPTSQGAPLWNAAAVFTKAVDALKGNKQSNRFPVTAKDGKSTSSPSTSLPVKTTPEADTSPQQVQSVLLVDGSTTSSEDCCTLSGASCSRRSGTKRADNGHGSSVSANGLAAERPTASSSTTTTTTTSTAADSPFTSSTSPFSPRGKPRGSLKPSSAQTGSSLKGLFLSSVASSPVLTASSSSTFSVFPLSSLSSSAKATTGSSSSSSQPRSSGGAKAMVGQSAGCASVPLLVRKAISSPLERVGVLSKSKEKQE
ncbi:hypothetical protein PLESTB_000647400 [Pleodorina starrii]|uniref:Uncharacterized protein n=1 Tax=Pleodorina starrii TaxID=330485 RepID=A0A9W6BIT7_9CHLO|nr:hypothetical protein PLESTM_001308600 [Pleodorina starrii]GLC52598.1 hypothetical protein PLESTB_000647400 [Pleodorina starrii]GLC71604.1 hypothetical protein PLESTF_001140100 [Pleodorina starrii]